MTKISIVMPVYGVEKYIADSIRTICSQTFRDFELILVDDGSPDNSIEIAKKELEGTDIPYQVITQKNRGLSCARNVGITNANGEWFICLDSDDGIHPQTLEMFSEVINQCTSDVAVIGMGFQNVQDFSDIDKSLLDAPSVMYYERDQIVNAFLLRRVKLFAPGLMVRKAWYDVHGLMYNQDVRFSEDQYFIWNLLSHVKRVAFIENQLYWYLRRGESIMTGSSKENIMTGYCAFQRLDKQEAPLFAELGEKQHLIFPRWILGVLHAVSKYMSYGDFEDLANAFNYRQYMQRLYKFPDMRVLLLARLMRCSKRMFYLVARLL